jgi:hypothetical protein
MPPPTPTEPPPSITKSTPKTYATSSLSNMASHGAENGRTVRIISILKRNKIMEVANGEKYNEIDDNIKSLISYYFRIITRY